MFWKDNKKNNHGSIGDHKLHAGVLFYEMNNICVVLRSESLSWKCAKLHTVAASNNRDHMPWSLYYSLFVPHIYMWVVLHTHPIRGESHIQRNANWEVATTSPLFTTNHANRTFFLWRLHLTRPSHPGYSTILLRSESSSGKCAKLHTVAASNNRDHMPWSL